MRHATISVLALMLLLTCLACGDDSAGADASDEVTAVVESEDIQATPTAATPTTDTATTEPATAEPAPTESAPTDDSTAPAEPAGAAEPLGPIELEPTGEAICGVVADVDFSAVNDATDVPLQPGDDRCLWLPSDGRTIEFAAWATSDLNNATGDALLDGAITNDPNAEIVELTNLGRQAISTSSDRERTVNVLLNDTFVLMVLTFQDYTVEELTGLAAQFLAAASG